MNKKFTISIFTEDKIGLLNRITIIFTRRHINIQSITASESEIKGVYRYTIVVEVQEEQVKKLSNVLANYTNAFTKRIEKQ